MRRRGVIVLMVAAGALLVAGGVVLAVDRLLAPASQPGPRLDAVPPATLSAFGISLQPAAAPPYCGALLELSDGTPRVDGPGGCPISRSRAASAAREGTGLSTVHEIVLARVDNSTTSRTSPARLAWVAVLEGRPLPGRPLGACPVSLERPPRPGCAGRGQRQLVIVDAHSAQVLMVVPLANGSRAASP